MSFNSRLRDLVFGRGTRQRGAPNPMVGLPAGVSGMTWQGTGFDTPPAEPVELDAAQLPWELRDEADIAAGKPAPGASHAG